MKTISFPHMGNYYVPITYFLSHVLHANVMIAPKISNKTVELGCKYSPEFVCMPFKYTLGTFIEALENGADVLVQAGGGCRYGYYSELQEQILRDLKYDFTYVNLVSCGKTDLKKIYHAMKKIDPKFSVIKALYYAFITSKMIKYMDTLDDFIRRNIGFEKEKGSFLSLQKKMLQEFSKVKSINHLYRVYKKYKKEFHRLEVNKPKKTLKIGIIGELYTLMEPFANYDIEYTLASYNMEVKRYTNVRYLVFEKGKKMKKYLKYAKEYVHFPMGADAMDNIARCKYLCEKKYDGILHIKSSFCTPEIGAMPIINKICKKENVPVMFLSFDANTSEVGLKTRLEAFYDMIEMRDKNENMLSRN